MAKLVIDASVSLKWVLQEPNRQKAIELRDQFKNGVHEFLAPDIFIAEVGEVLSKLHRIPQAQLTLQQAEDCLGEIMTTPPTFRPIHDLMPDAFDLSLTYCKGLYDCLYIALARKENCSVVTADSGMVINTRSRDVVLLNDLP